MDDPLQDCTIEEQRGVVRFLWVVFSTQTGDRMRSVFGEAALCGRGEPCTAPDALSPSFAICEVNFRQ